MGEREQINIPGTVNEHPNWRRKLPLALEDLEGYEPFRRVAEVLAKSGRSGGDLPHRNVPDFPRVFADRAVGREPTHARRVEDRHAPPVAGRAPSASTARCASQ